MSEAVVNVAYFDDFLLALTCMLVGIELWKIWKNLNLNNTGRRELLVAIFDMLEILNFAHP